MKHVVDTKIGQLVVYRTTDGKVEAGVQVSRRNRMMDVPVELDGPLGDGAAATIRFAQPEFGVAPGQAAVLYAGDRVVGGGSIERTSPSAEAHPSHGSSTQP